MAEKNAVTDEDWALTEDKGLPSRGSSACIYCLRDTAKWSTEHVLPRALGTFEQSLTLTEHVCEPCNHLFSKFEGLVSEESIEGLLRNLVGVHEPRHRASPLKHVEARLKSGPAAGALYSPVPEHDITQVGFKRKDGDGFQFFPLKEFNALKKIDHDSFEVYEPGSITIVLSGDEEERKKAFRAIDEIFLRLGLVSGGDRKGNTIAIGDPINLGLHISVPREASRMYAKIAFNYLAYVTSPDFVRAECFDYVRNFARYGVVADDRPLVLMRLREPDMNARTAPKSMKRHILAAGLTNLGSDISGLVVLFDVVIVKFKLCRFFPGNRHPQPIARGTSHVFDLENRMVQEEGLPPEFFLLA